MSSVAQPYPGRTGLDVTEAKDELRRAIRAERDKRTPRMLARAADDFAQVIGDMPQLRGVSCVAAYVSRPKEPGTIALIERLAQRGVEVLLPVLGAGLQRDWAWYTATDDFAVRAPGRPPEPAGPTLGADALAEAQVIVVPALAVDTTGARLGQGGGWYDRVLAHANPTTPTVSMVFPEELYDAEVRPLPQQEHDRLIDLVATTAGWQELRGV
ncbi:5-formyltetrahydrofolate cyclo-ligase [Actinotalea sp. Marseille-Q4924]|uniref:5-formyltetrahydrofolate cyclo-ligase n=1 Tax=Actinotalea sp. Marseille-Q4924 TaxID=2866571 RepID=UPI001CE3EA44|nr:5-formyltetrahydrofolate cyclo-ligase [Actinotalea sp. Marseille-Q4924]